MIGGTSLSSHHPSFGYMEPMEPMEPTKESVHRQHAAVAALYNPLYTPYPCSAAAAAAAAYSSATSINSNTSISSSSNMSMSLHGIKAEPKYMSAMNRVASMRSSWPHSVSDLLTGHANGPAFGLRSPNSEVLTSPPHMPSAGHGHQLGQGSDPSAQAAAHMAAAHAQNPYSYYSMMQYLHQNHGMPGSSNGQNGQVSPMMATNVSHPHAHGHGHGLHGSAVTQQSL